MTKKWSELASKQSIDTAIKALEANGFQVIVAENGESAKKIALGLIPEGAEVMNMTSVTLDAISVSSEIQKSEKFKSARESLMKMDRQTQGRDMQRLGAAPEWSIGSAHAITEDGKVVIASNTGSQIPAYAYGSDHVIWVVGGQKIVKNLDEALKRIYEHTLPLESERAKKAYGVAGSFVSKILIINKEQKPGRAHIILVHEVLGF